MKKEQEEPDKKSKKQTTTLTIGIERKKTCIFLN